ncbi:hypothetical protein [Streptomyces sp. NPDC002851]
MALELPFRRRSWKPPRIASWCGYAKFWIHTKYRRGLKTDSAAQSMLNRCSY